MIIRSIAYEEANDFVLANITDKDSAFYSVDVYYFANTNVSIYGCFSGEDLVGLGCLAYYPYNEPDRYPQKLGYSEDEAASLLRIEASFVHPDYRGKGIQGVLLAHREEVARNAGYKYLCVSMAPENVANCRAVEKAGFVLGYAGEVSPGKTRRLYAKSIQGA